MKVAVAGLGFMGLTHLRVWRSMPQVKVVAVASDDPVRLSGDLREVAGNLGLPGERLDFSSYRKYSDWREAALDPEVEAVDICLPTDLHAEACRTALEAGKHVLVEKPLALDSVTARQILDTARAAGRTLMVAQVLRFFPAYRVLQQMAQAGNTGAIRTATFRRQCAAPRWSAWLLEGARSGGAAFDLLVHDADMCIRLFGLPAAVSATGFGCLERGTDWFTANLRYPETAVSIAGGWGPGPDYPFSMEYSVAGEGGVLEYNSAREEVVFFPSQGGRSKIDLEPVDPYHSEIEYFFKCCRENSAPELCPPADSAAAVRIAECMVESRRRGGEWIACGF